MFGKTRLTAAFITRGDFVNQNIMDDNSVILEMKGICKSFSGVEALRDVQLDLR